MPSVDLFETFEVTRGARPRAWLIIFGYLKSCVKKERGTENDARNDEPPFSIKTQASFARGSVQVDVILGYHSVGFFREFKRKRTYVPFTWTICGESMFSGIPSAVVIRFQVDRTSPALFSVVTRYSYLEKGIHSEPRSS